MFRYVFTVFTTLSSTVGMALYSNARWSSGNDVTFADWCGGVPRYDTSNAVVLTLAEGFCWTELKTTNTEYLICEISPEFPGEKLIGFVML